MKYIVPRNMAPLAIRAAIAAPFKPIAGMGPKPKIIIGSIMIFAIEAMIINKLGRRVSPVALILLIPTIPTTTKGTPKYNISMYPLIRGIISFGAPRDKNKLSMVSIPRKLILPVIMKESNKLSVANLAALVESFAPIALATTEEVPAPRPIATLITIISIG